MFDAAIASLEKQRDDYDEKYLEPYAEAWDEYGYEDDWTSYASFKPESSFMGGEISGMYKCRDFVLEALRRAGLRVSAVCAVAHWNLSINTAPTVGRR